MTGSTIPSSTTNTHSKMVNTATTTATSATTTMNILAVTIAAMTAQHPRVYIYIYMGFY